MNQLREICLPLLTLNNLYLLAGVLALLVLLFAIARYRRNHRGIVPFKSEGGLIEIAPHTLRSVMQYAVNDVDGIVKADCHHFVRGDRIGVRVDIHLEANRPLREVESAIKAGIRRIVRDQFGIESVNPVHIRVVKIIGEPSRLPPPPIPTRSPKASQVGEAASVEAFGPAAPSTGIAATQIPGSTDPDGKAG